MEKFKRELKTGLGIGLIIILFPLFLTHKLTAIPIIIIAALLLSKKDTYT